MTRDYASTIASAINCRPKQAAATIALIDDGATVPFIARYRKEATGSLDEVAITAIRDQLTQLRELDKRREAIVKSLDERDLLTDELKAQIDAARTMAVLEDIYLPFRPKRRTRATIAKERGLEPLAELIFAQDNFNPAKEAEKYLDAEKEVTSIEDALSGARDIIAEWINEDTQARARLRDLFSREAIITSQVAPAKEAEGAKYKDYFDWEELLSQCPSHRILAMRRGETESILRLHMMPPEDKALGILDEMFVIGANAASRQVIESVRDSYKRLLGPAMETEIRAESRKRADEEAIRVFAENLRELLMTPPLGRKNVLAIDPGLRTGCKVVCLDRQGSILHYGAIFPHLSDAQREDAATEIKALCQKYKINTVAIGNGTAGRETEAFVRELGLPEHIAVEMVSEAGASVYSASETAREELPEYDVTIRGAASIGRRLMDPLAELVKIDPKSIGVGQYQHDVDQTELKSGLDDTVMSCVNAVGVEVNTASKQLLTYVSGLGPQLAQNIIDYRNENGPFKSRTAFRKVPRLGPKAFEQAAGFMRIVDADNPLDRSAVHPESYTVVEAINLSRYVTDRVGMPTLEDIRGELAKPGRDPRAEYESFQFDESVKSMEDLKVGMQLPAIVTNVTAFGAFVDIGVHQDGLVHISELADRYVKDPAEIVKVHQRVTVTVLDIDLDRKRIALSMRQANKS